jgi:catechol 2,3-dioxygenase
MAQPGAQAAFFAAGGYHHHLRANTWESAGAAPPPPGSAALRHVTLVPPDNQERDRLLARLVESGNAAESNSNGVFMGDPSGNMLELSVA